ncbi:MAG: hypothetical protein IPL88_10840 [Rhizobiales bacterium]|nr:hypothetical protein [Hyphomicrobiales bacterium]
MLWRIGRLVRRRRCVGRRLGDDLDLDRLGLGRADGGGRGLDQDQRGDEAGMRGERAERGERRDGERARPSPEGGRRPAVALGRQVGVGHGRAFVHRVARGGVRLPERCGGRSASLEFGVLTQARAPAQGSRRQREAA